MEAEGAHHKGEDHAGEGHADGLAAHRHQFVQLAFQAGEEQQGQQADLRHPLQDGKRVGIDLAHLFGTDVGQGGDRALGEAVELAPQLWRLDQVQPRNADQHAGHQLPQDGGKA